MVLLRCKKAQSLAPLLILVGLLLLFLSVVVLASTKSVLGWAIDQGKEATQENNPAAAFFISLLPFMFVFVLLVVLVYIIATGGAG